MSESTVRETLRTVHDTVDVPAVDRVDLAARTRRLRRRRWTLQTLGAGAALVTVVGAALAPPGSLRGSPEVVATTVPEVGVPVVVDGEIQVARSDGTLTRTGHGGTPIGVLDGRLVWLDAGVLTGPDDLRVEGVRAAFASGPGVTYQDVDGAIHLPGGREPLPSEGDLVAAGDSAYVTEQGGVPTLHTDAGSHVLALGSDGSTTSAEAVEVGDDAVMVAAGNVVSFFDLDGTRRGGFLGGATGALSPDGDTYAYAASERDRDLGMRPGLTVHDVETDRSRRVRLDGDAVDLSWQGDDLLVLTEQAGSRTLSRCRGTVCSALLADPTGTLALR